MCSTIRKLIDNLLLLEDLLFHKDKQCSKCIKEKFMLSEKIMEEIIESDKKEIFYYPIVFPMIDKFRNIQKKYPKLTTNDKQQLRKFRKNLMNKCFKILDKNKKNKEELKKKINHKCKKDLLPILDARFNIREAVKNMLLLEDHLLDKRRRCMDCCKKHILLIESFLDEAISLDKKNKYVSKIEKDIKKIRTLEKKLLEGRKNYFDIAMEIRKLRKKYFQQAFDYVSKC